MPTSHEAPMMSGPSPSPILPAEPKDNKLWRCIQCDATFPQSKLLETHAVDTDHKAYRCTKEKACGKLFILRPSWIRHERSHSAQKTHACSRCGKKFHRKDNCHDHERTCGRVARRARGSSQSASTSPATTSPGTMESGTPIDLLTTILEDEDLHLTAETGHKNLLSFNTFSTSRQYDNGNDYKKGPPTISRRLGAPPKSPLASSATCFSTTRNGPRVSHSASLWPEPEHDTLLLFDNADDHTISRNVTAQPHADNDWRHYYQIFQSPHDAPSPDLQHTEENWKSTPVIQPCKVSSIRAAVNGDRLRLTPSWFEHSATGDGRVYEGGVHNNYLSTHHRTLSRSTSQRASQREHNNYQITYHRPLAHSAGHARADMGYAGNLNHDASNTHDGVAVLPDAVDFGISRLCRSPSDTSTSVSHSSEPEPEREPRSKITIFFAVLKEYIKAPFRSYKQWQHGW